MSSNVWSRQQGVRGDTQLLSPKPDEELKRKCLLDDDEKLIVSLVSRYSLSRVRDVIDEACLHQIDKTIKIAEPEIRQNLMEFIEKNCKGYEDRTVGTLLGSGFWQALKKEKGI